MLRQRGAKDRERFAVALESVGFDQGAAGRIGVAQCYFADLMAGHHGDGIGSGPDMDDATAVRAGRVIVDNGGVIENVDHLTPRQTVIPRCAIAKVTGGNERVTVRNQSEVKTRVHMAAAERESDPHIESGPGRQWRPAAIRVGITPSHPGRSPCGAGRPNPAIRRATVPSAIMEGRPAPRIIGLPIPTAIGQFTSTTATVGCQHQPQSGTSIQLPYGDRF